MFFDLRKRKEGKCIYDEGLIFASSGPLCTGPCPPPPHLRPDEVRGARLVF